MPNYIIPNLKQNAGQADQRARKARLSLHYPNPNNVAVPEELVQSKLHEQWQEITRMCKSGLSVGLRSMQWQRNSMYDSRNL
jgi:hypothetical protein